VNRVAVLTPPGVGAIATLEVAGPDAWRIVRALFHRSNDKPLPDEPSLHRTWFGTLDDEVVLAVTRIEPEPAIEIHAHGGTQVVKRLQRLFEDNGCRAKPADDRPREIEQARTLRTAAILLDQLHGAFDSAIRDPSQIGRLVALAPVGRHLVEPWKVVIAGAPNVGKSSLVNAIAGFQRSIVSPVAGTTRDIVTTFVALDGWPVELADTAGLRNAIDSVESEGVELARRFLSRADLVVWLLDGTESNPVWPTDGVPLVVVNKADRPLAFAAPPELLRVSASTGTGIESLVAAIVRRLVPVEPIPGEAVPYTAELADLVERSLADPSRLVDFVHRTSPR
jgi:tRNA modification GTPase